MLTVTRVQEEFNLKRVMVVAVDVSKEKLDVYTERREQGSRAELRDELGNNARALTAHVRQWQAQAQDEGYDQLLIGCEPTGGYEKTLLSVAHQLGALTCYVSAEATKNNQVIISNDNGKSDPKDARNIYDLICRDHTLKVRQLPELYEQMRQLNHYYECKRQKVADLKNQLRDELLLQFPDLRLNPKQLFGPLGKVLACLYGFDPHRISSLAYDSFARQIRAELERQSIRVMDKTLEKIHRQAHTSALHLQLEGTRQLRRERLRELLDTLHDQLYHKAQYGEQLVSRYRQSEEYSKLKQIPDLSDLQLARLIAELGPLSDFASYQQAYRFLGVNLRRRQSGKHEGAIKLSKKGRSLGRSILYQLVTFGAIGKGKLLHELYIGKTQRDKKKPNQAIAMLMRKLLRVIWGVCRSDQPFDLQRMNSPLKATG